MSSRHGIIADFGTCCLDATDPLVVGGYEVRPIVLLLQELARDYSQGEETRSGDRGGKTIFV